MFAPHGTKAGKGFGEIGVNLNKKRRAPVAVDGPARPPPDSPITPTRR
jgi:hypothetical protein